MQHAAYGERVVEVAAAAAARLDAERHQLAALHADQAARELAGANELAEDVRQRADPQSLVAEGGVARPVGGHAQQRADGHRPDAGVLQVGGQGDGQEGAVEARRRHVQAVQAGQRGAGAAEADLGGGVRRAAARRLAISTVPWLAETTR